jgi:uncharacterized protein (TIGR03435 family)
VNLRYLLPGNKNDPTRVPEDDGAANEYARICPFGRLLMQVLQARIRRHAGMAALLVSSCAILLSQPARSPTFEVASVKRVDGKPGDPGFKVTVRGGPETSDPERVTYTNQNLLTLVFYAYDARINPTDGSEWLGTEHYNIEAKIPPGTTLADFRLMLQNLLAERFHMVVHHVTKEYDGYDLLVAKGGLKMKTSSGGDSAAAEHPASGPLVSTDLDAKGYPQLLRPGIIAVPRKNSSPFALHLMARAQPLSELAKTLTSFLGSPIVDKNGLSGRYDFTLDCLRGTAEGMQWRVDAPDDSVPYIPHAVGALGLRMVPAKIPLDTVIVDSADKMPTEN